MIARILGFLVIPIALFGQISVTFQVNLAVQIKKGLFVYGRDSIVVRGDFQTDAGDADTWSGNKFKLLPDAPNDSIFKVTATLPAAKVGTSYLFKFVKNDDVWDNGKFRPFTLAAENMILYPYYFNNDSIRPKLVTTAVTFFADLRKISGTGFGFFDNSTDSISVVGFGNWDTMGAVISGDRRLRLINPTSNRMYSTTLTLKGYAGDSTRYSYVCYPGIYFENSGWENIIERYIVFPYSDSTYSLPTVVPNIFPLPLLNINVLFTVQFPDTARNAKNNQLIPRNEIEWVGLKGNIPQIGNWAGNWTPTDTILAEGASYPAMTLLNDKGHNGDIVPGDGVWSTTIVIPTSTGNNLIQYRYAVMYPGADTINRRVTPLDNESTNGQCHQFIFSAPQNGSNMVRSNIWGQMEYPDPNGLSDIKRSSFAFRLDQNFPNPFNPSTKIGFMIPEECHVTIKVYNMIGKEVSTLVDRQMRASSYETDFNARSLSSGLYFYKLSAGSYTAVKKMMFVK